MPRLIKDVTRGNPVTISATFKDANNQVIVPPSATLVIAYRVAGVNASANVVMSQSGNVFSGVWSSAGVDPGVVDWCVVAGGGTPVVVDGSLRVQANKATP